METRLVRSLLVARRGEMLQLVRSKGEQSQLARSKGESPRQLLGSRSKSLRMVWVLFPKLEEIYCDFDLSLSL